MQSALHFTRLTVKYGTYPLTFLLCLSGCWWAIATQQNYATVQGPMMLAILAIYLLVEYFFPLCQEWRMTSHGLFNRDLKFLFINGVMQAVGQIGVGWIAINISSGNHGLLRDTPMYLALPVLFLVFEFLQYVYHRLSHEAGGRVGKFLWSIHATHHLPDRVYVLIQTVAHPLDLLTMSILLVMLLPNLLGVAPEVALVFVVFSNLHSIASHINADLRLGWLNYLVAGPELHRFHHSANRNEAKNYGGVIMVFDHLFGTFVYRPGQIPETLGVAEPGLYPDSTDLLRVLSMPFRSESSNQNPVENP